MISPFFTKSCLDSSPPLASLLMTPLLMRLLRRAAHNTRAELDPDTIARVAKYPPATRALVWGLFVLGIAGAALITGYNAVHGAALVGISIGLGLVVVLVGMVAEFTRVRVEWTDTAVSFASPWSAPRSLEWDEIVDVTYSRTAVGVRPTRCSPGLISLGTPTRMIISPETGWRGGMNPAAAQVKNARASGQ